MSSQTFDPLEDATQILYAHLFDLGFPTVFELYRRGDWVALGQQEFGRLLGDPELTKNFFLTAVELWLHERNPVACAAAN